MTLRSPDVEEPKPSDSDRLLGRALMLLGVIALVDLVGILLLAYVERPIPDVLVGTLGGAVTGVAGLLAARRS